MQEMRLQTRVVNVAGDICRPPPPNSAAAAAFSSRSASMNESMLYISSIDSSLASLWRRKLKLKVKFESGSSHFGFELKAPKPPSAVNPGSTWGQPVPP
jgi:hypothetical protein